MPDLPDEIISDILSRLPVVSLCRFRCVSKPWRSLISHPDFIRTHLNRNANNNNNNNEHLVLSDDVVLHSADIEWSQSGDGVHLTSPTELDLDLDLGVDWGEICGSCDGLLLIGFWMDDDECNHYSLVNPSTREFRKLPQSPFTFESFDPWKCFNDYGLGYDSQSDDYKVVSISHHDPIVSLSADNLVSVYALRTNTWKKIESSPYDHSIFGHISGVFVSGALHWFAGTGTSTVIVALDLADEKFRSVPSLGCTGDTLTVLGGCLCVSGKQWNNDNHADFWVMKEYGVSDSWTKFTVAYDSFLDSWKPLTSSRIGRVLFQVNKKKLVLFDPQEEKSNELLVQGLPTHFEAETYVESLVSPNWQC